MDRKDMDDALYGAMVDALANSGVPITSRAKSRIADELTAEALRLVTAQMKADGNAAALPVKKTRKARGPNKPRGKPADTATGTLPGVPPALPPDATTPAPFGHR
jgi:hypothetical protein